MDRVEDVQSLVEVLGRDEPGERRREPLARVRLCDRSLIADDLKRPAHVGFEHGSVAVLEGLDPHELGNRQPILCPGEPEHAGDRRHPENNNPEDNADPRRQAESQ